MASRQTACERIRLITFGYKYLDNPLVVQALTGVDLQFNVRFIPNPYHVPELRELDGSTDAVRDFVFAQVGVCEFVAATEVIIRCAIERYLAAVGNNFREIKIAFGCAGGRQRSVVMAVHFAAFITQLLAEQGWGPEPAVIVDHLTIDLAEVRK